MPERREYRIEFVQISQLRHSPYQPDSRLQASPKFNALVKSIREKGLQYPPLATLDRDGFYTIVDGHGRVAAYSQLGYAEIPVIVTTETVEGELFADLSATQRPVTAVEWIEIYLKGGQPPTGPTRTNITKLEKVAGRHFLERLATLHIAPTIWQTAGRVIKYAEINNEQIAAVLNWLVDHKLTYEVQQWIRGGMSSSELRRAFEENRKPSLIAPSSRHSKVA